MLSGIKYLVKDKIKIKKILKISILLHFVFYGIIYLYSLCTIL